MMLLWQPPLIAFTPIHLCGVGNASALYSQHSNVIYAGKGELEVWQRVLVVSPPSSARRIRWFYLTPTIQQPQSALFQSKKELYFLFNTKARSRKDDAHW